MNHLFVYGTLGPGGPNEHILQKVGGTFEEGFVRGKLYEEGWGANMGFPGIRLDDPIDTIEGYLFVSEHLEKHWAELDAFEGDAYRRVETTVILNKNKEEVEAFIYELA